ncbi:MAG: hypothetical protein ACKVQJ_09505 [Pyrinomonadaceae bacterium]
MRVINLSSLSEPEFALVANEVSLHKGLNQVLAWATGKPKNDFHPQIVSEVVTQDEYTHDIIVPYGNVFLVYDTT